MVVEKGRVVVVVGLPLPFLTHWTTESPREPPLLCHQHADEYKVGPNLGPSSGCETPRSLSCILSLSSSITHANKENFSTVATVSALRVSPALPPPSHPPRHHPLVIHV